MTLMVVCLVCRCGGTAFSSPCNSWQTNSKRPLLPAPTSSQHFQPELYISTSRRKVMQSYAAVAACVPAITLCLLACDSRAEGPGFSTLQRLLQLSTIVDTVLCSMHSVHVTHAYLSHAVDIFLCLLYCQGVVGFRSEGGVMCIAHTLNFDSTICLNELQQKTLHQRRFLLDHGNETGLITPTRLCIAKTRARSSWSLTIQDEAFSEKVGTDIAQTSPAFTCCTWLHGSCLLSFSGVIAKPRMTASASGQPGVRLSTIT